MKAAIKPIKRSEQLAPLSREHHDGLLFVWKIKQGIEGKVYPDKMAKYALWYWRHHIKPHFFQEEKILLPYLPTDHELAIRLKDEHEQIRELVLSLDTEADKHSLLVLCDLIDKHIRFEERELFMFLEKQLTKEQLDDVYAALEAHPVLTDVEWQDEFWVKK